MAGLGSWGGKLEEHSAHEVITKVLETLAKAPPTIGVVGVSGTGKSSTINAMFKSNLAVGHSIACTKEFRDVNLKVQTSGHLPSPDGSADKLSIGSRRVDLRLIDAPGLGEDIDKDPEYLSMYGKNLGVCDVILWVMTARNRAIALDQRYIRELRKFGDRIVFGINQVDLIDPTDWQKTNLPSAAQQRHINEIVDDRAAKLGKTLGRSNVPIIPYSAKRGWGLQGLYTELVSSAPRERTWIFDLIKGFHHLDFLPADFSASIDKERPAIHRYDLSALFLLLSK